MDLTEKNKGAYKLQNFGPIYCINLDGQPERWHYMEDQYSIGNLLTMKGYLPMMVEKMT